MRKAKGFTLVEVMIVVAIVGVLAAVAIPMYIDQITRGQLVEGHTGLNQYRVQMEQFYQDNRNYGPGACGVAAPAYKNFAHNCQLTNGGQGYLATAQGSGERVVGFTFTIDQSNARQTTATPANWDPPTMPAPCFVTRKKSC